VTHHQTQLSLPAVAAASTHRSPATSIHPDDVHLQWISGMPSSKLGLQESKRYIYNQIPVCFLTSFRSHFRSILPRLPITHSLATLGLEHCLVHCSLCRAWAVSSWEQHITTAAALHLISPLRPPRFQAAAAHAVLFGACAVACSLCVCNSESRKSKCLRGRIFTMCWA
jgi:hypothetical protein